MKTRRSRLFLCIVAGLGLIAIVGGLMFHERILLAIGEYLVVVDELHEADVVAVIAGEDYRTEHAIRLYQQGYGKRIFFTGGWCEYHNYYHGLHGKELAVAAGVSEGDIAFDDTLVTSTYNEAERLKTWIDASLTPILSVIIVSDPFHMRRAQWTYQRVLGAEIKVLMSPVPDEHTPYKQRWWEDDQSRSYVKNEYQKLLYYIARYQLSGGSVREWLASFDTE